MPKKTTATHSPKSLRATCERVRSLLLVPEAVADKLAQLGIEQITIGANSAVKRAMKDLSRWATACNDALTDELYRRGMFQADTPRKKKEPKD
jgi:hypothetical protein